MKAIQRRKSRKLSRKCSFHFAVQVMKYMIQYLSIYCREKIKQR